MQARAEIRGTASLQAGTALLGRTWVENGVVPVRDPKDRRVGSGHE
jgi:hypothetical protein